MLSRFVVLPVSPSWITLCFQWNEGTPLQGTNRPDVQGLFELEPREHAAPFIRMLAHPALLCRLQWMLGPCFSCHQNTAICSERGTGGQQMHAGAGPGDEQNLTPEGENNPQHLYAVRGQQTFCNKVNVAWQLTDTGPSDGGFVSPPSATSTDHLVLRA